VELERSTFHRLERRRERRKRPLVRGELDDVLQPELPLYRLDRLPRLVGHEAVDRGAEEAQSLFLSFFLFRFAKRPFTCFAFRRATIFPTFSVRKPTTAFRLFTMLMQSSCPIRAALMPRRARVA